MRNYFSDCEYITSVYCLLFLLLFCSLADQLDLQIKAVHAINSSVIPGFRQLREFLAAEYLPVTRAGVGVSSLPGGERFYSACLQFHTSTNLTAQVSIVCVTAGIQLRQELWSQYIHKRVNI